MTIRAIIGALQNKGYSITYRFRKDGGVIITKIGEQRFSGAKGNTLARAILGESLSEKRASQLQRITKERVELGDAYKKYLKVAKKWRSANLPKSAGKISFKKFKFTIKEKGIKEALRILSEKEKYASGIAYSKNIKALSSYVEELATRLDEFGFDGSDMYDLASSIEYNDGKIREEDINPAYDELYRLSSELLSDNLVKEVAKNTKRILKI